MNLKNTLFVYLIPLLIFLSGCESGPRAKKIHPPIQAINTTRIDASKDPLFCTTKQWIGDQWWTLFHDEQLSKFIYTAFTRNPTLQAAKANICLAKATADRVRASLYPNIWWGADASRQKLSETGIVPFGTTSVPVTPGPFIPEYFSLYETELNLTYNFDLWGKNRNTLKAALGEVNANIADTAFSRLQLGIAVATTYFQLQINYKRRDIAEQLVKNRVSYLKLQEESMLHDLSDELSVNTAKINLLEARRALINIQSNIEVAEHQLKAYLADQFEECIASICIENIPLPKIPLPCDIPLHLISHRPDILAQLWLIESAGKQIEVAKAGFYPDFNITALYGYQTIHFRELFKWPSSYFNVDPAVSLPIFDGGRLIANLRGSEINYDLAIYQYNEMVLTAAKEVLDGITLVLSNDKQYKDLQKELFFENENLHLTKLRVAHNIDSGFNYLNSEENFLLKKDQELISLGNIYHSILLLIKSLGGGYSPCYVEL
ncbi:MAG: efflux transporter outer membrane subunit [Chlamydiales bacterium]|nr:efflux transporter outer membrane subunit [Chlamydiales bacterium]